MKLWQAFKMAFKSISMKKTRSFLTMLGIIIGVASVVIMVTVVQGQNKKNMEFFEKMGDNKITVQAYSYYDANNETSQKLYDYCLSLGDLIVAEPDALIGFAGPRVIKDTTQARLPEGFQTAEFLLQKGLIDRIIERKNLRKEIALLLEYLTFGANSKVSGKRKGAKPETR